MDNRSRTHFSIRSTDRPIPADTPYPSPDDQQIIADIHATFPHWGAARIQAELSRIGRSDISVNSVRLVVES